MNKLRFHDNIVQGSPEWKAMRAGRLTASIASKILTPTGKISSSWEDLAFQLTAETLDPDAVEEIKPTPDMIRGNEHEPLARAAFTKQCQHLEVVETGFVTVEGHAIGFSPDAILKDEAGEMWGGLETKCPRLKKHLAILMSCEIPAEWMPQIHFSIAVTGLPWFFVSYYHGHPLFKKMVEPDETTEKMRDAIFKFSAYYNKKRGEIFELLDAMEALQND